MKRDRLAATLVLCLALSGCGDDDSRSEQTPPGKMSFLTTGMPDGSTLVISEADPHRAWKLRNGHPQYIGRLSTVSFDPKSGRAFVIDNSKWDAVEENYRAGKSTDLAHTADFRILDRGEPGYPEGIGEIAFSAEHWGTLDARGLRATKAALESRPSPQP